MVVSRNKTTQRTENPAHLNGGRSDPRFKKLLIWNSSRRSVGEKNTREPFWMASSRSDKSHGFRHGVKSITYRRSGEEERKIMTDWC